jgi:hypothetical protein
MNNDFQPFRADRKIARPGPRYVPGTILLEGGVSLFGPNTTQYIADSPSVAELPRRPTLYRKANHAFMIHYPLREMYYPYASDFIEETRLFGFRVPLPSSVDCSVLSPHSLIHFIHARACLVNSTAVRPFYHNPDIMNHCALYKRSQGGDFSHLDSDVFWCSRDWYADAQATDVMTVDGIPRFVRRFGSSISYAVIPPALGCPEGTWAPGCILFSPISAISVVVDEADAGAEVLEMVQTSVNHVPVEPVLF